MTYSDEYIEHWGGIYLANPKIRLRGILFESFLVDPPTMLETVAQAPAPQDTHPDDPPLQRLAKAGQSLHDSLDELEALLDHYKATGPHCVRHSNGREVEPLSHHRYPRRHNCDFRRKLRS